MVHLLLHIVIPDLLYSYAVSASQILCNRANPFPSSPVSASPPFRNPSPLSATAKSWIGPAGTYRSLLREKKYIIGENESIKRCVILLNCIITIQLHYTTQIGICISLFLHKVMLPAACCYSVSALSVLYGK